MFRELIMGQKLNFSGFKKYDDIELMRASFTSQSFKPHFHEQFSLILVENGLADYSYKKNEYVLDEGKLLILNPYEVHTGKSLDKGVWNSRSMYLSQDLVKEVYYSLSGSTDSPYFKESILEDKTFLNFYADLHQQLFSGNENLEVKESIYLLIEKLLVKAGLKTKEVYLRGNRRKAKLARDYIHNHYSDPIQLEDLEEETGLSKFYFIKLFESIYGLSPNRYLNNLRIEKAKRFLYEGMSCQQVAHSTGFYDQSHFTRHFKRIVGVTPTRLQGKQAG